VKSFNEFYNGLMKVKKYNIYYIYIRSFLGCRVGNCSTTLLPPAVLDDDVALLLAY